MGRNAGGGRVFLTTSAKGCVVRQEEDSQPVGDNYPYTMFIDLKAIIDKQWKLFGLSLPADLASHKPDLTNTLNHLNDIRNRVMHPVKGLSFTEEEFAAVRSFHQSIDPRRWRMGEFKV